MANLKVERFGMKAGVVFRGKYFDEQGNLTYNFVENAAAYPRELLFISGEDNRLIGPEYQRDQMKYFPRARLEVIPDAGHTMFNENPKYTFRVIRTYLSE
jgi:pimeloyl-ACP methyl ester carboxylesterase